MAELSQADLPNFIIANYLFSNSNANRRFPMCLLTLGVKTKTKTHPQGQKWN